MMKMRYAPFKNNPNILKMDNDEKEHFMAIADDIIKKVLQITIPMVDLDSYRLTFP